MNNQPTLASILPFHPSPLTQELCRNYLVVKHFHARQLSTADQRVLGYIEDFIKFGGLNEGRVSIEHNNEALKRIIQRARRPSRWRRLINWLNEPAGY